MRSTLTVCWAAVLCLTIIACGRKETGLSGTWSLNEEKSQLGEGRGWRTASRQTITRNGLELTLEKLVTNRSGEEETVTEKYTLDGTPADLGTPERPRVATATIAADSTSLTISSTSTFTRDGNQMEVKSVEVYQLMEGGACLQVDRTSQSPRGERKQLYVYDRARD